MILKSHIFRPDEIQKRKRKKAKNFFFRQRRKPTLFSPALIKRTEPEVLHTIFKISSPVVE